MLIENHGSIILIRPQSEIDDDFIDTQIEAEDWARFGGAIAVEPRLIPPIVEEMQNYGCVVELA
jgi:hypothetical protein